MNSKTSGTSNPHRLLLNLLDKIELKRKDKYVALSNLSFYYTWKNIKKSYKNKFKISTPTWNKQFELPDESYYVSDIQYYFEYILKNPLIRIYVNKIENESHLKLKQDIILNF